MTIQKAKIKVKIAISNALHFFRSLNLQQEIRELKKKIQSASISNVEKKQLRSLLKCGVRYKEYITEFLTCDVQSIGRIEDLERMNCIVVCVVKNDLMRMKLFLEYYRNLGVKHFAILDDQSSDGTHEYLEKQEDVVLFKSDKAYSTVRRQVWINKIIQSIGYNKWYLIVDSDELFDYKNSASISLPMLVDQLAAEKVYCVKALMLDMFSAKSLFADDVKSYEDICRVCNMFLPKYRFSSRSFHIFGGAREELLKSDTKVHAPTASKYPLIYMRPSVIAINSHNNYPYSENEILKARAVLRHYKFLPQDRQKYLERIEKQNFYNGSSEYKAYFEAEKQNVFQSISSGMKEYTGFDSVENLDVIGVD